MNQIHTFTIEDLNIDFLFQNGFLGYSFEYEGNPYGQKVRLKTRKVADVSAATFLLIENALATYKKTKK